MRVEKIQLAQNITALVEQSSFMFLITYKGLTVAQFDEFRLQLRAFNATCQVHKNTLLSLGFRNNGIEPNATIKLTGDTAVVFGAGDPGPTAKAIKTFSKGVDIVQFKGAIVDRDVLSPDDTVLLADLPPKEIVQSQLLGVLQAPMTNLARVFNAKLSSIVHVLKAYHDKTENSS